MLDTPEIVQTAPQDTAIIRFTIPRSEIGNVMGPGFQELAHVLADQGLKPSGAFYSYHHRMDPEVFDFEIGVPVSAPVQDAGRVTTGSLPATTAARTVYHGGYEGLASAWGEFGTWIGNEGHTPAPGLWEVYATGPESGPDPSTWRTELYRPLQ